MKQLYAPWRSNYIHPSPQGLCVFCKKCNALSVEDDAQHFIIKRFQHCYVMLNLFPYNAGHLLIIPYEHQASLEELPAAVRHEIMDVTSQSITVLKKALQAEGFNVGINMGGKAAGGSIPEHLHVHILPRWLGDTNFLVTLAETKQISDDLHAIYQRLKDSLLW